jgi:DNA-directed RNA polymerase subunit alpha
MEERLLEEARPIIEPVGPPKLELKVLEAGDTFGRFSLDPLEHGLSITLGNPLRRLMLSSIQGTAVTWVKIDGVMHEFSTIPNVKEDVTEILMNIKSIRLKSLVERPGKMRLDVKGRKKVTAGDIVSSAEFEVVNPNLHLATLDSPDAYLSIEFNIEQGKGYVPAYQRNGLDIGVLPVDAVFTPVRKVNFLTERTRVGQRTDYERLILEVWTDETITPIQAVQKAAQILVDHMDLFLNIEKQKEDVEGKLARTSHLTHEQYEIPVEDLGLSTRTLNCLRRANIDNAGQVFEKTDNDLLSIRNFGEQSLHELHDRLAQMYLFPEARPQNDESHPASDAITEVAP